MNLSNYKEIEEIIQKLILQLQVILSDKLIGFYVGGSLANGSYHSDTSDIDCYVITKDVLTNDLNHKLENMHKELYASQLPYAKKIEASYIPQKDLMKFDLKAIRPYFNEGQFYLADYGNNFIIELYLLREKGITVIGPDIEKLIKKISSQKLSWAIHKNLDEYWKTNLENTYKFIQSDYQVFAIFTMCRTLYSLETGGITSKREAANWAISRLNPRWGNLIKEALAWKPDEELNLKDEAQEFVKFIINESCTYKIS